MGVDPGTRVCGYGVIAIESDRSLRVIECGTIAPARNTAEGRVGELARWLTEVIEELDPEALAVEDVFTMVNARSALALAQARGAVLAVAGIAKLPVFSYAPASVKKAVTGRGRASKEQVALMVQSLVGLRSLPEADATDALAVAITHAHSTDARWEPA